MFKRIIEFIAVIRKAAEIERINKELARLNNAAAARIKKLEAAVLRGGIIGLDSNDVHAALNASLLNANADRDALHDAAIDMDAQIGKFKELVRQRQFTDKRAAQDRAAAAILELHALPSGVRVTRAIKKKLEKMIADVADEI